MQKIPDIYLIAIKATLVAAEKILRVYKTAFHAELKKDGSPVTEADLLSSKIIHAHLAETGLPIIGEERINLPYSERKNWEQNWCVDPLDGTKEFVARNDEFCINIAHIVKGKSVFGIINEPCKARIIFGGTATGVFLWHYKTDPEMSAVQEVKGNHTCGEQITWIASRRHKSADAAWVNGLTDTFSSIQKVAKGSAIKFFDLALGSAQIYPQFAPTMEWDIAAGQAILEALGGSIHSVEDGKPLVYNKESLYNPYFVAKTGSFIHYEKSLSSLPKLDP